MGCSKSASTRRGENRSHSNRLSLVFTFHEVCFPSDGVPQVAPSRWWTLITNKHSPSSHFLPQRSFT